jgi:hypothetical protein
MKRIQLALAALALVVTSLAAFAGPAMADDWDWNDDYGWYWDSDDAFDDGFFLGGNGFGDFEQEAESGDVDQSFDVPSTGDNSDQTVSTQGVANTGNAQNQIGITQWDSDADDFEFDGVGSSIDVSPSNSTPSDQEVNQAASAFGS